MALLSLQSSCTWAATPKKPVLWRDHATLVIWRRSSPPSSMRQGARFPKLGTSHARLSSMLCLNAIVICARLENEFPPPRLHSVSRHQKKKMYVLPTYAAVPSLSKAKCGPTLHWRALQKPMRCAHNHDLTILPQASGRVQGIKLVHPRHCIACSTVSRRHSLESWHCLRRRLPRSSHS